MKVAPDRQVTRTNGDHRLYNQAGVERLYRIRRLRGLGMALDDIRHALGNGPALADLLRTHREQVEAELDRLMRLRDRLRSIAGDGMVIDAQDLLATLDAMARVELQARKRRRSRSSDASDPASNWHSVGDGLRACMDIGEDPSNERVRAIAARARSLIDAFAGGDGATLAALARLRTKDPPRGLEGWDADLTHYLDRALAALDKG